MDDADTIKGKRWYGEQLAAMSDEQLAKDLRENARTPYDFHPWAIEMAKAEADRRKLVAARADGVALARLVLLTEGVSAELVEAARAILAKVEV